jgi:phosphoribosylglycinamide formyltransferase 1
MKRIAIFASGQGTNAAQLIRYFQNHPTIRVTWVVSNRSQAPVLHLVSGLGVEATYFEPEAWQNGKLLRELQNRNIDLIVLAGFLKLLPESLIKEYPHRIINIHPALLPKYGGKGMYGLNVHQAVVAAGEKETGITIHFVNERFDEGEIIAQYKAEVLLNDSVEEVEKKVRALEKQFFAKEVERIVMGMDPK